jgi:hypothetical protein
MLEHRQHPRIRSFLRGEIVHSAGAIRIECTVRDLSTQGARIQVPRSVPLPDPFDLQVPQRHLLERCSIIWRHADEVGVTFLQDNATSSEPVPLASIQERSVQARVQGLETEITQLKRQLAAMRSILERMDVERG